MVNLTIRLAGSSLCMKEEHHSLRSSSVRKGPAVPLNVADIDVPILRGLGISSLQAYVASFVGSKVRRQPGDKVHVCVRCNFPIAVYGRLDPCEHVYCLMCAKLDSTCFLCDERVVRIQKMDVLEGIFICGAPCCLRSFFTRSEFESHVAEVHSQLLEQEKISSVKTISMAISVLQAQEPVGTLHVIFPKKEEPQWKSPKSLWQHSQNVVVQPIPELQLPNQFPHHCAGNLHANSLTHCSGHDLDTRERYQEEEGCKEWPLQTLGQRDTETEVEWTREGQSLERGGESGLNQSTQKREDSEWQYPRPFSHAPPREIQREHLLHQPTQYQPVTLPPPYSLPAFSPQPLQQEQSSFPSQFDTLRGFHPGTPIPFRFEYHENTSQLRNLTPSIGMQQGDRLMNITPQDGFYQVGPLRPLLGARGRGVLPRPSNGNQQEIVRQNGPLLHFLNDFGLPLGIPHMSAIRFQEGHLPPPPAGPPPKRAKCNGNSGPDVLVPGEVMMDHMWGPGNPGSFGGHPGGHAFQGKDN